MTKKDKVGRSNKSLDTAQTGEAAAQRKLAEHLKEGDGIPQSLEAALLGQRKAAATGDPEAMISLGSCDNAGDNRNPVTLTSDESLSQESEIEYYDDWSDSGNYFVCIDRHYIFAANGEDTVPHWKLLNSDYAHWDAVHQRIYRQFRLSRIKKEDLPPHLPPPPEGIPPEALSPPSSPPSKLHLAQDYPVLNKHLRQCGGGVVKLFLVLFEDTYESLLGDGEFHYPETIFFNYESAVAFEVAKKDQRAYHIRPGVMWLDGDTIKCEVPGKLFDHFSDEEVLSMANAKIEQEQSGDDHQDLLAYPR